MKSLHSFTEAGQVVSVRHSLPQMVKLHEELIAITYTFQESNPMLWGQEGQDR